MIMRFAFTTIHLHIKAIFFLYLQRCDDNKTCSEWISALVESLSSSSQITLENKLA